MRWDLPFVPREVVVHAAANLATVDYSVATRVSAEVSRVVEWAYLHDVWWIVVPSVQVLRTLDDLGSALITAVVWLAVHSQ